MDQPRPVSRWAFRHWPRTAKAGVLFITAVGTAIDEYYLTRVHAGQSAVTEVGGQRVYATVRRVWPQVKSGLFAIDLEFENGPPGLVAGQIAPGRLQLGGDTLALIIPTGAFLSRSGGYWLFVLDADGKSARPRQIKVGRRTAEQVEILSGLTAGERVVISDYTGLERCNRLALSN